MDMRNLGPLGGASDGGAPNMPSLRQGPPGMLSFSDWMKPSQAKWFKKGRDMSNPQKVTLKNGRPATQGTCPVCGTTITRIGKE